MPRTGTKKTSRPSSRICGSCRQCGGLSHRRAPPPRTTVRSIRSGLRPVASLAASDAAPSRLRHHRACQKPAGGCSSTPAAQAAVYSGTGLLYIGILLAVNGKDSSPGGDAPQGSIRCAAGVSASTRLPMGIPAWFTARASVSVSRTVHHEWFSQFFPGGGFYVCDTTAYPHRSHCLSTDVTSGLPGPRRCAADSPFTLAAD